MSILLATEPMAFMEAKRVSPMRRSERKEKNRFLIDSEGLFSDRQIENYSFFSIFGVRRSEDYRLERKAIPFKSRKILENCTLEQVVF